MGRRWQTEFIGDIGRRKIVHLVVENNASRGRHDFGAKVQVDGAGFCGIWTNFVSEVQVVGEVDIVVTGGGEQWSVWEFFTLHS